MKPRIADYVFLIVYLIVLILLLFITPVTIVGDTGSGQENSTPFWREITWLLLYLIGVPLLYLIIRRLIYPKKRIEQP